MKKVLFDGIACQGEYEGHYHGGADYGKFILDQALKHGYKFDVVVNTHYFTHEDMKQTLEAHPEIKVIEVGSKQELYQLIGNGDYDVFYSPQPYPYFDYPCKTKLIGVIHGIRKIEQPWDKYAWIFEKRLPLKIMGRLSPNFVWSVIKRRKLGQFKALLSLPNAEYVTVSEHTKYSLLTFFPNLTVDNLSVFYSPFSTENFTPVTKHGNYYLLLNANRYEKNSYRAIKAFDQLFSDGRLEGKKVVVTGCQGVDLSKLVKNVDRFDFLPYVPYSELIGLYREAFCFVYPSLNEGFGYPPVKAMACGVPVMASTSTSIPEVCGDAACYFSPTNVDDMKNRILQMEYRQDLRERLIKKGFDRVTAIMQRQSSEIESYLRYIFD